MSDDGLLTVIPDTEGQIGQYLAMAQATASMTIETSTAAPTVEAFLKGSLDTSTVGGDLGTIDPKALVLGAGRGARHRGRRSPADGRRRLVHHRLGQRPSSRPRPGTS